MKHVAVLCAQLACLWPAVGQPVRGCSATGLDLARLGHEPMRMVNALWVENSKEVQFRKQREVVVADLKGPGVIRMMHFAMPGTLEIGREVVLRIWWDDERFPSVETPLPDFFCSPNGELGVVNTAVLNTNRGFNCYLAMPFRRRARIVVSNDDPHVGPEGLWERSPCYFYILWLPTDRLPPDVGNLHAVWRKEALVIGRRPYLVFRARGRGKFVGWNVSVRRAHPNRALLPVDLNENLYLDAGREPDLVFQGMEDSLGFSYGFPPEPSNFPYTGWHPIEAGYFGYRFFLHDAISFNRFCKMTVAFGPQEPHFIKQFSTPESRLEFATVAYWYQREPHEVFTRLAEYAERLPAPSVEAHQRRMRKVAEMNERGILLDLYCGRDDIGYLGEGFDWRLLEGYAFFDRTRRLWHGQVNYCWASWTDLVAEIVCPRGTEATLRLFIIDPDVFAGGRRERIICEGRTVGVFADFAGGRWVEAKISAEDTEDRKIQLRIENAREGSNVVVSRVQLLNTWAEAALARGS
ncbi:MAG: DUF2961 domain-containing protein [Armatimonadota bacterium]